MYSYVLWLFQEPSILTLFVKYAVKLVELGVAENSLF